MAKQTVNIGASANDGTGDGARTAFDKLNDNFNELYTALGDGSALTVTEIVQDIAGGMVTGNTETLITVTYQDADGTIDFVVDNNLANYDNTTSGFLTAATVEANVDPANLTLADAGGWFTTDNVEAATQQLGSAVDGIDTRLAAVEGAYITASTAPVQYFDAGGSSSAARPSVSTNIVIIWYNTGGLEPTNLGPNDIWQGIPGTAYTEKTASYTAVLADAGESFGMNLTSTANTFTIPTNASAAFVVGTKLYVTQIGTGVTTVAGDTGVTVNGTSAGTVVLERWQTAVAHKVATDTWLVSVSEPGTALKDSDIGVTVQAYDADTLKADTSDQLTAGFSAAVDDDGTQSSGTYTPAFATGNFKQITNGGAFTLAPPSPANDEAITLTVLIINNGSAGAITTSGFTAVKGDSFTTTDTHKFLCHIDVYDDGGTEYSVLSVVALQ